MCFKFILLINIFPGGSTSQVLQYVHKPLLSRDRCEDTGNKGHLDDTMLCAGQTGRDACQVYKPDYKTLFSFKAENIFLNLSCKFIINMTLDSRDGRFEFRS